MAISNHQLVNSSDPVNWLGHFIGGSWRNYSKVEAEKISYNPSRGKEIMKFTSSREAVDEAIDDGEKNAPIVKSLPLLERIELFCLLAKAMNEHKEDLVKHIQLEVGKPSWDARAEVEAAIYFLEIVSQQSEDLFNGFQPSVCEYKSEATKFLFHPVGVTVAYIPFSSPVSSFVNFFVGTVLAGCPLIIISSTHAALCTQFLTQICESIKLPKGILNSVFGGFKELKLAAQHKSVKAILYTGSKEHRDFKNFQLILHSGGKNSGIVHSTADIDLAVKSVLFGTLRSAGQLCSSTSRVFVFRSVLPEFIEKISNVLGKIKIGPTDIFGENMSEAPLMGPLYSQKAVEKFLRFQTMANREAQENIHWGKGFNPDHSNGYFVYPGVHLMKEFDQKSSYQNNMLLSPDLAIYTYDVLAEAISCINSTNSSLSVSFYGDEHIFKERAHLFHAPNLLVNLPTTEMRSNLPLAGRSLSTHHRYNGIHLAYYLSHPQAFINSQEERDIMNSWPWVKSDEA